MAIKSRKIIQGVRIWINTKKPSTVWLELGKKRTASYLDHDAVGVALLAKLPQPWGVVFGTIAARNRKKVKNAKGPNGVWIKASMVSPFYQKAKKRTKKNRLKKPSPW